MIIYFTLPIQTSEIPSDYDAVAVRSKGKGGDKFNAIQNKGGSGAKASGRLVPKPRNTAAAVSVKV